VLLTRKQFGRLREIGTVLVKYGWGQLITKLGMANLLRYRGARAAARASPQRMVEAIEELGPTFIKFGQLLSTRSDLLPQDYIDELSKLQDTAPTIPIDQVKAVIREEMGRPVEEVYGTFIEEPLAAASLGQVHAAALPDGTRVIVKVQRPGIRDAVERDLSVLYVLARFLERRWERARTYGLVDFVDEFSIIIRAEMDYTREAHNTERLKQNLAREHGVCVPGVHWDLTTARVLTVERIDGAKVTDIALLDAMGVDRPLLARRLAATFLQQMLVDGFFHADPHPGNILITAEHDIALIDAGEVRQLDVGARTGLLRLLIAFERRDTRQFAEEILALGISRGEVDLPGLTHDLEKLLRQYYDVPARATNLGQILSRVMDVSARHRIRLPTGFTLVGKVLANIDGINRKLDPNFNFTETARSYIRRSVRHQLRAEGLLADTYSALLDAKAFLLSLPEHMNLLMHKLIEGSIRIEFKHTGLGELESRLDKIANRLAFALIVGAAIIGSSLIVVAKEGPTSLFGLPLLGVVGYVIALVFGLWLLISIIRSGRL